MSGVEKYNLTEEEFQASLAMAEIATLIRTKPYRNPKSIFIISQAGGGKTGLKAFVANENQRAQTENLFIELNPDEVAIYHKYYKQILEEYPNESHSQLQKFVLPALDNYLRKRAVQLRNNIIQEGTFGSTEGYIKILDFQRNGGIANIGRLKENGEREEVLIEGGYNIEIDILAVDRFESLLSSYEREQFFIESNLPPRAVTAENHDRAYFNMLKTVSEVENRNLYNKIRVFKRGYSETSPELVHVSGDQRYHSAVECIVDTRNRNRMQLLSEPEKYLERIRVLKEKATTEVQLEKISKLEEEFNQELKKYKEVGR